MVLAWVVDSCGAEPRAYWIDWWFVPHIGWTDAPDYVVTHWRDIAPPNSSATLTGSDDVPEIGFGNMAGGD
jgi:hypothetical protein